MALVETDGKYESVPGVVLDGREYTLHSNNGIRRSQEEFENAAELFVATKGKSFPPGFTVLPSDSIYNKARNALIDFRNKIPGAVAGVNEPEDEQLGGVSLSTLPATASYKLAELLAQTGIDASSPSGAMSFLGELGANLIPGRNVTLPVRMLYSALGSGTGAYVGNMLQGNERDRNKEVAVSTLATLASEGATGLVRKFLGHGISERAQQQVEEQLMKSVRGKLGTNTLGNLSLENVDVPAFTQAGERALRESYDDSLSALDYKLLLSGLSSKRTKMGEEVIEDIIKLRQLGKQYFDAVRDGLVKVGDSSFTPEDLLPEFDTAYRNFAAKLLQSLKGLKQEPREAITQQILTSVRDARENFLSLADGAKLISALKEANAGTGLNVGKFQRVLLSKYLTDTGSLINQAGVAAGRNAPLAQSLDRSLKFPLSDTLEKFGVKLPFTKFGGVISGSYNAPYSALSSVLSTESKTYLQQKRDSELSDFVGNKR